MPLIALFTLLNVIPPTVVVLAPISRLRFAEMMLPRTANSDEVSGGALVEGVQLAAVDHRPPASTFHVKVCARASEANPRPSTAEVLHSSARHRDLAGVRIGACRIREANIRSPL